MSTDGRPQTPDEFNRYWFVKLSSAWRVGHLGRMVRQASGDPLWNGSLAKHVCRLLVNFVEHVPHGADFWIGQIRSAGTLEQLGATMSNARHDGQWSELVYHAYLARAAELRSESAVRLDERIRVLREVRNDLAKSWRTADPYGEGTGLYSAEKFLSWKLGEARRAAGVDRG